MIQSSQDPMEPVPSLGSFACGAGGVLWHLYLNIHSRLFMTNMTTTKKVPKHLDLGGIHDALQYLCKYWQFLNDFDFFGWIPLICVGCSSKKNFPTRIKIFASCRRRFRLQLLERRYSEFYCTIAYKFTFEAENDRARARWGGGGGLYKRLYSIPHFLLTQHVHPRDLCPRFWSRTSNQLSMLLESVPISVWTPKYDKENLYFSCFRATSEFR